MALGHNRRFLPAVAEMKAQMAAGAIGTLLHVEGLSSAAPVAYNYQEGMWRADRDESPLGGMGGMGIHMVDMIINLAGRFQDVRVISKAQVSKTGRRHHRHAGHAGKRCHRGLLHPGAGRALLARRVVRHRGAAEPARA